MSLHLSPRTQGKWIAGIILGLVFLWEWRKGSFKEMRVDRHAFSVTVYQRLLLSWVVFMAILLPLDPFLHKAIQSFGGRFPKLMDFGGFIGRNVNFWIVLSSFYFLSLITKRAQWARRIFGAIVSGVFSGVFCHLLKFSFLRARPDTALGPFSFFNGAGLFQDARAFQSFPSGDVALVGGAASYFFYGTKNLYLRLLILLFPLTTALARVNANRHWFSDTVAAIWMSLILARLLSDCQKKPA